MREDYVRPPLIAREAPSRTFAVWRYRVIALLLLLAIGAAAAWALFQVLGVGNADPGFGGLAPISAPLSPPAAAAG